MKDCKHEQLQSWYFQDNGKPVGMWSCTECHHKFVPLDVKQEQDAARYRYLVESSVERDDGWVIGGLVRGAPSLETLEDAIDAEIMRTR